MFALCIESSHARGMGHLYRSMNLADALLAHGHSVTFMVNDDHPVSHDILAPRGYTPLLYNVLDESGRWERNILAGIAAKVWINDRLDTTFQHASLIKKTGLYLATFDDRGEGAALSDLHIAALALDKKEQLQGRTILRGPQFLILDPEIAHHRRLRTTWDSTLVTLGGADTWGVTPRLMRILAGLGRKATVVIGPSFLHYDALKLAQRPEFTVKRGVQSMIEEMSRHSLAITGGGITPFEAQARGLPCIIVANEDHEIPVGMALEAAGGAFFAGHHTALDESVFLNDLDIPAMSKAALDFVTTEGTERVVDALELLAAS